MGFWGFHKGSFSIALFAQINSFAKLGAYGWALLYSEVLVKGKFSWLPI